MKHPAPQPEGATAPQQRLLQVTRAAEANGYKIRRDPRGWLAVEWVRSSRAGSGEAARQ